MELKSRNTNTLQPRLYRLLSSRGVTSTSRNGPVLKFNEPVSIMLTNPWERVNLCPVRDANPFFHLWEGLAMLAGVNSVPLMGHFAKNMLSFTDDGRRYNAFYGERARVKWGDQIDMAIEELISKPDSRQCVVNLWDPTDWHKNTKDKACNLQLLFSVDQYRRLCMTTTNRSNDAIFGGVTGANIVHLSMFQEYVALATGYLGQDSPAEVAPEEGFRLGPWWHFSNNLHAYTDNPKWNPLRDKAQETVDGSDYGEMYPGSIALFNDRDQFDYELAFLMDLALGVVRQREGTQIHGTFTEPFLANTAVPMFNAWAGHKMKNGIYAINEACRIEAPDWRTACINWLVRRYPELDLATLATTLLQEVPDSETPPSSRITAKSFAS